MTFSVFFLVWILAVFAVPLAVPQIVYPRELAAGLGYHTHSGHEPLVSLFLQTENK